MSERLTSQTGPLGLALVPGFLFVLAWAFLASGHFAAWDVMDDVASTTTTAKMTRGLLGPIGFIAVLGALVAGWFAARQLLDDGVSSRYISLNAVGVAAITIVIATTGIADDRIYPLAPASVDVVPAHSVVLLALLAAAPLAVVFRPQR